MRDATLRVMTGVLACLGASPVLAGSAGFAGIAASADSAETASDNPAGMSRLLPSQPMPVIERPPADQHHPARSASVALRMAGARGSQA